MVPVREEITVKPEIMLLEQALAEISRGRLRVPRFQRPFVWRPEQMLNLFDSIERGYPIGSLLVWDTRLDLPSLDRVAEIPVPDPDRGDSTYLLDGHQRLSTLFGSLLARPERGIPSGQREWMWRIYRVLGVPGEDGERFRHWKRSSPPPANFLPMRAVLRTMDFLAFSRELSDRTSSRESLEGMIEEAEELAHRIKSYQVAVVRLKGGDLRHAVEVFSRLNSSGQGMTPDQMVSALTYQAEGVTLADRIAGIREDLASIGYSQVAPITVFRTILAVAGEEDVQDARWETLAKRISGGLGESADAAGIALDLAAQYLREYVGVPLARLVPYQLQLLLLAAFFNEVATPTEEQKATLARWFWGTSWSGFFAGANSTQVKNSLKDMRRFAAGKTAEPWDALPARPFPDKFDLRSARVRSFILWELREYPRRLTAGGAEFDPVDILARSDTEAYRHVIDRSPSLSHPANRMIMPTRAGVSIRTTLANIDDLQVGEILRSHGIPESAFRVLCDGNGEDFILQRASSLATLERNFMLRMGIQPSELMLGDADIDTE